MAIAILVNLFAVSITALLNTISAWWHMAGVVFIVLVLIIVPDSHQSVGLRLRRDDQQLRVQRRELRRLHVPLRLRDRLADGAVHDHGLRCLGAHGRGDEAGLADGRDRNGDVGGRLGDLRLLPSARRDVRDPGHPGRYRRRRLRGDLHLADRARHDVGEDPALHRRDRADVLPDRIGDFSVTDDVRVLARPRCARSPALAPSLVAAGADATPCWRSASWPGC